VLATDRPEELSRAAAALEGHRGMRRIIAGAFRERFGAIALFA
jgi:hypothetical protein